MAVQLPDPPAEAPSRSTQDNATFSAAIDEFLSWVVALFAALNDWVAELMQLATGAYAGVSASPVTIGLGAKSFTASQDRAWIGGHALLVSSDADPANFMRGTVDSYDADTGALVVDVTSTGGSGEHSDWNIALDVQTDWGALLNRPAMVDQFGALTDPGADRIAMWDESGNIVAWLAPGANLSINGTNLDASAGPWTQIGVATPTGVNQVDFTGIPATYNDLLLVCEGVSHNSGSSQTLQFAIGKNGVFASVINIEAAVAGTSVLYGAVHVPGYLQRGGIAKAGFHASGSDPGISISSAPAIGWRSNSSVGIDRVRLGWSAGNFDAGTVRLLAR